MVMGRPARDWTDVYARVDAGEGDWVLMDSWVNRRTAQRWKAKFLLERPGYELVVEQVHVNEEELWGLWARTKGDG